MEDYYFLRKVLGCETVISDIQLLGRNKEENKEENEKDNSKTYANHLERCMSVFTYFIYLSDHR